MKISKEAAGQHRERILMAASRLLREQGPDVSVAEVTKAAGLTHGAFYNHFASKEALLEEAMRAAMAGGTADLQHSGRDDVRLFSADYLSIEHLRDRGGGCPVAALVGDVTKQPAGVQAAFADGVRGFVEKVEAMAGDRRAALTTVSTLVGALTLARAVADADGQLAAELLSVAQA